MLVQAQRRVILLYPLLQSSTRSSTLHLDQVGGSHRLNPTTSATSAALHSLTTQLSSPEAMSSTGQRAGEKNAREQAANNSERHQLTCGLQLGFVCAWCVCFAASGSGSSTYTLNRAPPQPQSWLSLSAITSAAWTALDVMTLFARSLLDPAVRTLADSGSGSGSGSAGSGVRRVASIHTTQVRGSGPQAGGGNRMGGGVSGGAASGSSSSSSGGGGRIAGLGPTKACSTSS